MEKGKGSGGFDSLCVVLGKYQLLVAGGKKGGLKGSEGGKWHNV